MESSSEGSAPIDEPTYLGQPAKYAASPRMLEEIALLISGGDEVGKYRQIAVDILYRLNQMLRVDLHARLSSPSLITESMRAVTKRSAIYRIAASRRSTFPRA